jgi:hypothetical protein
MWPNCCSPASDGAFDILVKSLCGLAVRVPGYRIETYCVSCEVQTEFIKKKKWIYICYVEETIPLLWSSGQSSWIQIQRFDYRRYQIFWKVMGLERGPLRLASTTEELLGRNSSGSGLENRKYGRGDPLRWPRDTLYPQKLALTSSTSGCHSVGAVRSWTKATYKKVKS